MNVVENIGRMTLSFLEELGAFVIFFYQAVSQLGRPPVFIKQFFKQMEFIGIRSTPVVMLTGMFTGMVSALQTHHGFSLFGAESLVGSTTALGLLRELGPVLAALMVTARAGSAMTAEIGIMRVTQQIDALVVMGVNPFKYLIIPRIVASVIMMPMLTLIFDAIGMIGSYIVGTVILDIDKGVFMARIVEYVSYEDLFSGLIKSCFFGAILSVVGCYKGYSTSGGAEGVGHAATQSVVMSSVSVLVADYILTSVMF
ncbi:MAG TPA: ABC transporter permease [Desulfomonilia bacterium]|nr:ABC transporter permease [Thermodesulfobacteriota bacterium]HWR69338.1 ABC transporter permease [Desulfomonilia bacterium]